MQSSAPSSAQVLGPRYPNTRLGPSNLESCSSVLLYSICSWFCVVLTAFPLAILTWKPTAPVPMSSQHPRPRSSQHHQGLPCLLCSDGTP